MASTLRGGPARTSPAEVSGCAGSGSVGQRIGGQRIGGSAGQNLMLPIIPAMFVVNSLIVGATVEEAR